MPGQPQRNPWRERHLPNSYVAMSRTCTWCGGSGEDPHFGGSTNTCQTCAGTGIEEKTRRKTEEEMQGGR